MHGFGEPGGQDNGAACDKWVYEDGIGPIVRGEVGRGWIIVWRKGQEERAVGIDVSHDKTHGVEY